MAGEDRCERWRGTIAVGIDRPPHVEGDGLAQAEEGVLEVLVARAAFEGLAGAAGGEVEEPDTGLGLVAVLPTGPGPARVLDPALAEEVLVVQFEVRLDAGIGAGLRVRGRPSAAPRGGRDR